MSSARWIWIPHREYVNQHLYLRKRFELTSAVKSAVVRVTADTRYKLFVNGTLVVRGPARGFPQYQPVDELDIAPYLKTGPNVLAAHVLSFGISTAQNVFRDRAGFFCEGSVTFESGMPVELDSNHTWRLKAARGYRRYVARSASQMGYQEHYDVARDAFAGDPDGVNWMLPGYDDAAWGRPHILGTPGTLPWRTLQTRETPMLKTVLRKPSTLVGQWDGPDLLLDAQHEDASDVTKMVRSEVRTVAASPHFDKLETLLEGSGGGTATIRPAPDGKFVVCVFDFGETRFGYTALKVCGASGGETFDLVYGEQAGEGGLDVSPGIANASEAYDTSLGDRLMCAAGTNRFESVQARGFRYLMLVCRNIRTPITIEHVAIQEIEYPAEQHGAFACSDPLLNTIWETGVRTLRHCMADTYMDCPTRSQEQGWAATRVAGAVAAYALGDLALYRRGLKLMAQGIMQDGLMLGVVPSERPDCVIPDYSLHWIASLNEYHQFSGDSKPLKEHREIVEKVLGYFAVHAGERGLLGAAPNYTLFLDWAPGLDRGNLSATYNLLYLHALRHAVQIGNVIGFTGLANHCVRQANALSERIITAFGTSHRNLLVESVDMRTGEPSDLVSQHATALAVMCGVLSGRGSGRSATMGQASATGQVLLAVGVEDPRDPIIHDHADTQGGMGPVADVLSNFLPPPGLDIAPGPVRANLFFRQYVHKALLRIGLGQRALDDIRRTWGYMLEHGATTWWERMPMKPGASRCHAWSAHPTAFLSRHVLGLYPIEAGWRRFGVDPQSFDLKHAAGKVPTPHGDISISWTINADQIREFELTVPKGTEAYVTIDRSELPRMLKEGTHRWSEVD